MSVEKKLWHFPSSFRRFSAKSDLPLNAKAGLSRQRVSSVYLSDDSASDFIIVPEFDDSIPSPTSQTSTDTSPVNPPVPTSNSLAPNDGDPKLIVSGRSSFLGGNSGDILAVNRSRKDDLPERLDSAYTHIHSMPSAPSPRSSFSSDPQILRKQLGVPQHSVLNYPNHSSADLPNPHASPRVPAPSPISPSAIQVHDVSHNTASNNLGLRINTNVYPPRPRFSEPLQYGQVESAATALAGSSQCGMLDTPSTGTLRPLSSIPNSSKPPKPRVVKTIVSPSSSLSFRQKPSRGVLRKPPASSPPSPYKRQISLPQMRPPSPFKVDIPLHHTWHDRRSNFYSSEYQITVPQAHETKIRRPSGSTEILASLAWIGTPPMASNPSFSDQLHRPKSPVSVPDHFRRVIAVEDDSISDDVLVDQLEMVRRIGSPSERGKDISSSTSCGSAYFTGLERDKSGNSYTSFSSSPPPTPDLLGNPPDVLSAVTSQDADLDPEDAAVWQAARKAVLCIREIVRTEKKYQEALKMLLNAETATPPPPSMIPYVSTLVHVSVTLLKHFLEDPSAWGVSTAFVTSEDELEVAMVSWCAVAGAFFTDGDDRDTQSGGTSSKWRLRKSGMLTSPSPSVMKQTNSPLSPQLPPVFLPTSIAAQSKGRIFEEYHAGQLHQKAEPEKRSARKPESTSSRGSSTQLPSRKLSVRDLAIQPIQRVMRYVLLYKDLLDCTPPSSPSRLLVERALEAATRIARHCDRAQRNPAFSHTS